MGGRGAASGISDKGNQYGTEYHTIYQTGNIKFVRINEGSAAAPMETMTQGRVYVTVNQKDQLKSIIYYDKHKKRYKQVDLDHPHFVNGKKQQPHTHKGYIHDEKGSYIVSKSEQKLIDRVKKTWYNVHR